MMIPTEEGISSQTLHLGKKKVLHKIRAILFDLDNTLLATREVDEAACDQVLNSLHEAALPWTSCVEVVGAFYQQYRSSPAPPGDEVGDDQGALEGWRRALWREVLTERGLHAFTDPVFRVWNNTRRSLLKINSDIIKLLKELRKKYKLAIITNGTSSAQWEKIRCCELEKLVPTIIVSGDLQITKPDVEIFRRTFDLLSISPDECIMVGDNLQTDIRGGASAGVSCTVLVPQLYLREQASHVSYESFKLPSITYKITDDFTNNELFSTLEYNKSLGIHQLNYSSIYINENKKYLNRDKVIPDSVLSSVLDLKCLLR